MRTLQQLFDQRTRLNKDIDQAWRRVFPIGGAVSWVVGKNTQFGYVVMHGCIERLKVRNERTGKEVWLDLSRVTR